MKKLLPALRPATFVVLALVALASPAAAAITPVYILQWGSLGSGNGQFNDPAGVAVDNASDVYVADTGNNRIQKFGPTGTYLMQWGGLGSGNGQFSGPFGVAIDRGFVYVTDTGNNRVQKFTTGGVYLLQWGTVGTGPGQFTQPLCVAVDPFGDVYVTDYNQNRVQKFTSTGAFITQWGGPGTGNGQFNGIAGIAVSGTSDIHVTDSGNHRVQVFSNTGTYLGQYGTPGAGNGQMQYPFGIAFGLGAMEPYVVDTFNHRVQIFSTSNTYLTQWGSAGAGNGQFNHPHSAAVDGVFIYVADTEQHRIQKFGPQSDPECPTCFSPPDTCCEAVPHIGGPWTNVIVGTREADPGYPYVLTIFNLNSSPVPAEDQNWASMNRYSGPGVGWVKDSLGTVFGLTLDEYGNMFVCHTSAYMNDALGQVFGGGAGAVYRIDGNTGAITTFVKLPNVADPAVPPGENFPGLGNISYDCRHKQFFVTNHEDGKIYRIKPVGVNGPTGTVVETFDPLAPDNGLPGWAPLGDRLWGVQWHGDRVYYGTWEMDYSGAFGVNQIRSVGLTPTGAFAAGTDQHEIFIPLVTSGSGGSGGFTYSLPIADISFSAAGKMLLGQRGIGNETNPGAHAASVFEYQCSGGCWLPGNTYQIGDWSTKTNAEGGVDYDRKPFTGGAVGRVWASSDAIHLFGSYPDAIYGFQGMRPNLALGSNVTSMLVDFDGVVASGFDKMFVGDVEAPGCPPVSEVGTLCGQKFGDTNHNGIKDGGEVGLPGWTIKLTGPGGPYTAVTDANGNYCITNVLAGTYTVSEIGQPNWVQTAPTGGTYTVTLGPGQTQYGFNFGNYACAVGNGCVAPPPGMGAWWPFNQPLAATTATDVTHTSPAGNVALLSGGAAITNGGMVQRALCFPNELSLARVPNSNQIGINFAAGSFAIDVWVQPQVGSFGTPRMIAEKRRLVSPSPYKTQGWALYLNNLQSTLEIGTGIATQIVTGPSVPAGSWSHLAVSVDRSTGQGRWYLNGAVVSGFNFTPIVGSLYCTSDLYMGQVSPPFASGPGGTPPGLRGCIDELELFTAPLPAASVAQLYAAGSVGKCPEYLVVPSVTTICKTQTSVTVCFNIVNAQPTAQTYSWSIAGLPVGPGCSVAGPTSFTPSAGSITVPPGATSAPICITIPRPAGLTTHNATSCYAITFVNQQSGVCRTTNGTIRADYSCWCITPAPNPWIPILARAAPTVISIPIALPCDPPVATQLNYTISAQWINTEHQDPHALRLNGLPPGEPVIGTLTLAPNGQGEITFNASYPNGYDFAAPYRIVLEADTDGDGQYEPLWAARAAATYDSTAESTVDVAGGGTEAIDSIRLLTSPNPFVGSSAIAFSFARSGSAELGVYDLSGRLVRGLHRGALAAGTHRFMWNGRDDSGRQAPAGVYFVRLVSDRNRLDAKIVKVR